LTKLKYYVAPSGQISRVSFGFLNGSETPPKSAYKFDSDRMFGLSLPQEHIDEWTFYFSENTLYNISLKADNKIIQASEILEYSQRNSNVVEKQRMTPISQMRSKFHLEKKIFGSSRLGSIC